MWQPWACYVADGFEIGGMHMNRTKKCLALIEQSCPTGLVLVLPIKVYAAKKSVLI